MSDNRRRAKQLQAEARAQAKTITRDDVITLARDWAEASAEETTLTNDPDASAMALSEAAARVERAAEAFEKGLDAYRDEQVERARASAIAEIDHERVVW